MMLEELALGIKDAKIEGNKKVLITQIAYDSRNVKKGALFCAIAGTVRDGGAFIGEAVKKGAVAVLSETACENNVPAIIVPNARRALAEASCFFYGNPSHSLNVMGITGTNGKTTVAHIVQSIFKKFSMRCANLGTLGYDLIDESVPARTTTPQAPELQEYFLRLTKNNVPYAVMEVSSHALSLDRVYGTKFAGAVFTNLTRDHLDYHKTTDEYFAAKKRLFEMLSDDAWSAVNIDDPFGRQIAEMRKKKIFSFGFSENASVRAEEPRFSETGTMFRVKTPTGEEKIETPLLGTPNIYNVLAAIAAAEAMKLPLARVASALKTVTAPKGRFEVLRAPEGFSVIIDYAHTDDALKNLLTTVRALNPKRILTVFGCGGDRDPGKRVPMGRAAGEFSDRVFITSDNPRTEDPLIIAKTAEKGVSEFRNASEYVLEIDRKKAIVSALNEAKAGDIVVIAGKGHENYQIFKDRTIHFDDREVVEEIIGKTGKEK